MKPTLKPGIGHEKRFLVPPEKTVPHLYPESEEFRAMPEVFATGFFVGLIEWACVEAVNPHLDRPREQTLGTRVDLTHEAATPPGFEVVAKVELTGVEGRRLTFGVEASDGVGVIGRGSHERFVIDRERFDGRMEERFAGSMGQGESPGGTSTLPCSSARREATHGTLWRGWGGGCRLSWFPWTA